MFSPYQGYAVSCTFGQVGWIDLGRKAEEVCSIEQGCEREYTTARFAVNMDKSTPDPQGIFPLGRDQLGTRKALDRLRPK